MSFVKIDQEKQAFLIAQYIVELSGRGFYLPYKLHDHVASWLQLAEHDYKKLICILKDINEDCPGIFAEIAFRNKQIDQQVRRRLAALH